MTKLFRNCYNRLGILFDIQLLTLILIGIFWGVGTIKVCFQCITENASPLRNRCMQAFCGIAVSKILWNFLEKIRGGVLPTILLVTLQAEAFTFTRKDSFKNVFLKISNFSEYRLLRISPDGCLFGPPNKLTLIRLTSLVSL